MSKTKYILFDAANTLIHKPILWTKYLRTLNDFGHEIEEQKLKYHHKILSEVIKFPDRTSKSFYATFNAEVLYSLGIIPSDDLLDGLFENCKYLPWEVFSDGHHLADLEVEIGILSNFNTSLEKMLIEKFGDIFSHFFISERLGVAKPNIAFFQHALDTLGLKGEEIIYIGDSIKLDIEPAKSLNIRAYLIDREDIYKGYKNRMTSFSQLADIIK